MIVPVGKDMEMHRSGLSEVPIRETLRKTKNKNLNGIIAVPAEMRIKNLHNTPSRLVSLRSGNWFFMTPSIATKFQYINSLLFSFLLTTCFGPYGSSSGEIYD
jgi:hypothetical protein